MRTLGVLRPVPLDQSLLHRLDNGIKLRLSNLIWFSKTLFSRRHQNSTFKATSNGGRL